MERLLGNRFMDDRTALVLWTMWVLTCGPAIAGEYKLTEGA
jgi:hypothetical protein